MKTAKDLAIWAYNQLDLYDGSPSEILVDLPCYTFTEVEFKNFCEQLCKEQRESCGKDYEMLSLDTDLGSYDFIRESIENQQMPEIE